MAGRLAKGRILGLPSISIIIPVVNEATVIEKTLRPLQPMRERGVEIIVVDGGSSDQTRELSLPYIDRWVKSDSVGRALQMNRGAELARAEVLWFLHADTQVPEESDQTILQALQKQLWGRFNVRLSGDRMLLRLVEMMMNLRSCWSGIATGDQGIFLSRSLFLELGGFPEIPLMEDVAISRELRKRGRPLCIRQRVVTSSRRWEERGVIKTILLMWGLRFGYWAGVSPQRLARMYR